METNSENQIHSMPRIGDKAPSFNASTSQGNIRFPEDYAGKWKILFSHPADFTPVCTSEFMQTSAKQYQASRSSIETAEKGYDIAVKRYQAGSGTQLEINNSQLALTQAELNRSTSIYNWLTARTSLEKIEGSYITAE